MTAMIAWLILGGGGLVIFTAAIAIMENIDNKRKTAKQPPAAD